jgi:hypothetical protein
MRHRSAFRTGVPLSTTFSPVPPSTALGSMAELTVGSQDPSFQFRDSVTHKIPEMSSLQF